MSDWYRAAGVAVENTAFSFDKIYDYLIPASMTDDAKPGCRVRISFGHGSQRQGMIMNVHETADVSKLKSIDELIDKEPVMSQELLDLASAVKQRCYCTLFDACSAMLPAGLSVKVTYHYTLSGDDVTEELSETEQQIVHFLAARKSPVRQDRIVKEIGLADESILHKMYKKKILSRQEVIKKRLQDKTVRMIHLENDIPGRKYTKAQSEVLNVLRVTGDVSRKEICYFTGVSPSVVDNLVKKGICSCYDEEPPRHTATEKAQVLTGEIELTPQQNKAFRSLEQKYESGKASVSLLYGVTGSGKTSVFMKLIDRVNAENKGVICMVPEIALTPQLLSKFNARYGNRVAVFHSGLSLSKRLEEWKRVKSGEANIAVGTRSAVFAPLDNLGLIVMDEEQEYTYKSSSNPRFHAREIAKLRCVSNHCLLLLSSATPSLESFYNAKQGRYSLEILGERYGNAKLPHVVTVDMNIDRDQGNTSAYSSVLLEAIEDNLHHSHQSIILLNRRGHNTFVSCRSCHEVISCPNCSISLTFHSANNRLMCHYCGYSIPSPT